MKIIIKYFVILLIILLTVYMLIKIFFHIQYENDINKKIKTIPDFEFFEILVERNFSNKHLKEGVPVLFIYLNTECEFCVDETQIISENIEGFRNCQILMVSIEKPEILISYAEQYRLFDFDNLFILYDKDLKFEQIFGDSPFPSSFIFGKRGELIKIFKGKAKINELLKYVNE